MSFLFIASAFGGINDRFSGIDLTDTNFISMPEITTDPDTPISGRGNVFVKSNSLYFQNDAGAIAPVSTTAIQDVPAGGTSTALILTNSVFTVGADAGGDIVTLENGTAGQIAYIICEDATGVTTITPATLSGGTSITFNALGDTVMLMYTSGVGWSIIGGNSYTII